MSVALQMSAVVKTFGQVRALDGLDLTVREGEIHGFLGPNGSGKTTALRVLLGFIRADAGESWILGRDPRQDASRIHQDLAYVPGEVSLWPGLTGGEVLALIGRLQGHQDPQRLAELIEAFDLNPNSKIRTYSKGNRQKVTLIAALAADVALYLLDEPTIGLDPLKSAEFGRWIQRARREGRTVLLSSHILSEVQSLCDRVSILRSGRTVDTGDVVQMRHLAGTQVVARVLRPPTELSAISGVQHAEVMPDGEVRVRLEARAMPALLAALVDAGVQELSSSPPTLEDLFLQHYGPSEDGSDRAMAGAG